MLQRWEDFIIYKDYIFLKKLAMGGMANVYLARKKGAHGFEKLYAIKELHDHLRENNTFFSMFLQEAKLSSKLDHPNIVKIFDLLGEENHFFMVMEHIKGKNLKNILHTAATKKIDICSLALKVTSEILRGLDFAHNLKDINGKALNIIHRDISPQNIMISYDGSVKITDFGIAKAADNIEATRTGVLKGKVSYMSPEQAFGKKMDSRSDLYSVGIILYEMLTLKKCFRGKNSVLTLDNVRNGDYISIKKLIPDIDPKLSHIVNKALAYAPDKRYQSAAHFQKAIDDYIFESRIPINKLNTANFMHKSFADDIKKEFEELSRLNKKIKEMPYTADTKLSDKKRKKKNTKAHKKKKMLKPILNIFLLLFIPFLLFDLLFYNFYKDFINSFPISKKIVKVLEYRPDFLPIFNLIPYEKYKPIIIESISEPIKFVFQSTPDNVIIKETVGDTPMNMTKETTGIYSIDIMSYRGYNFTISKKGYREKMIHTNLARTNTIPHTIELKEKLTELTLNYAPNDAMLYVNGELKTDSSPYTLIYNPDNDTSVHEIMVARVGFEAFKTRITCSEETKSYSIKLEPKFVNITFKVKPWGKVYHNGKLLGLCNKDSSFLKKLQAGTYKFKFVYPDGDVTKTLTYHLTDSKVIEYSFLKAYGYAFITSYPSGADIYVDTAKMAVTPQERLPLKAGYRVIVIYKDGFKPYETKITIKGGEEIKIYGELEKIE